MKTVHTITINGTHFAVREGMKQADILEAATLLLMLRRIDYCCDKDYRKSFHFLETDGFAKVQLGEMKIYETEEAAREARDAHNATLAAEPVTS